jgi:hypothetical protein
MDAAEIIWKIVQPLCGKWGVSDFKTTQFALPELKQSFNPRDALLFASSIHDFWGFQSHDCIKYKTPLECVVRSIHRVQ